MIRKKFKTDEVYVVNQPKHSSVAIVLVDNLSYPPREETTERLFKLSEVSDIFLIFKDPSGIDPDKFAKLHTACSWIIVGDLLPRTFLKAIEYTTEVFKSHAGFLVFELEKIPEIKTSRVEEVVGSGINWPIFRARRLGAEEMHRIYTLQDRSIFEKDKRREYSTWMVLSPITFFRPSLVPRLLSLQEDYINSFTWPEICYFLGSACEYLGVKRIEADLFELDINKLRTNDTEREK